MVEYVAFASVVIGLYYVLVRWDKVGFFDAGGQVTVECVVFLTTIFNEESVSEYIVTYVVLNLVRREHICGLADRHTFI